MRVSKNHAGFTILEALIIVAVVGILGLVGFNVYDRQQNKKADVATQTTQNTAANNDDIPSAPVISKTEDLTRAEKTLDQASLDSSDSSSLDSELAAF